MSYSSHWISSIPLPISHNTPLTILWSNVSHLLENKLLLEMVIIRVQSLSFTFQMNQVHMPPIKQCISNGLNIGAQLKHNNERHSRIRQHTFSIVFHCPLTITFLTPFLSLDPLDLHPGFPFVISFLPGGWHILFLNLIISQRRCHFFYNNNCFAGLGFFLWFAFRSFSSRLLQ